MTITDTSIVDLLIKAFADQLEQDLMTDIYDESGAGVVRAGRLQDDPSAGRINILLRTDPDDLHELYTAQSGYYTPTNEIGGPYGAAAWVRRIYIEVNIFLDDQDTYDDAQTIAFVVLSRAEHSLATYPIRGMKDTFGEHADYIQVRKSLLRHEGGDNTWLFRGFIKVEVMTIKEYE